MGCGGCGSGSILPGALTARKRAEERAGKPKVKGHFSSGVVKSAKRLSKEAKSSKSL